MPSCLTAYRLAVCHYERLNLANARYWLNEAYKLFDDSNFDEDDVEEIKNMMDAFKAELYD